MIKGVRTTGIQEVDIIVREVKNMPSEYDKTERVLIIDADSIMYFASHFLILFTKGESLSLVLCITLS